MIVPHHILGATDNTRIFAAEMFRFIDLSWTIRTFGGKIPTFCVHIMDWISPESLCWCLGLGCPLSEPSFAYLFFKGHSNEYQMEYFLLLWVGIYSVYSPLGGWGVAAPWQAILHHIVNGLSSQSRALFWLGDFFSKTFAQSLILVFCCFIFA